ncbi:sigma-70 family RNA polymerase sigma factor [Roseateles amylovorans]|uniref:Sigma-70 family RNA polymerase sigma factor n=1 Tax=Roseateles amylovorans TaxID=2978473 RepID=A0ABY6B543_9BURK|nr:sigma-70 family RNA polymerase sigma factor [Roseateles amylovorans]UXH80289.1 sigma-70 family RNA polymerase sigma factor [Roseateles amylovorans]
MSPSQWPAELEQLRPQLLRYARLQMRNDAWAEDAVSETLLAALEKPRDFDGRSQFKTWLIGILKHKLVDQIRRNCKELTASATAGPDDDEPLEDLLFDGAGHWRETPPDWGHDPEAALHQVEFMQVLEACVTMLPPQQGRVFMMREWLELDTDEICREAGVSTANIWVLLHRARLRLRECLQQRWFISAGSGAEAPAAISPSRG